MEECMSYFHFMFPGWPSSVECVRVDACKIKRKGLLAIALTDILFLCDTALAFVGLYLDICVKSTKTMHEQD